MAAESLVAVGPRPGGLVSSVTREDPAAGPRPAAPGTAHRDLCPGGIAEPGTPRLCVPASGPGPAESPGTCAPGRRAGEGRVKPRGRVAVGERGERGEPRARGPDWLGRRPGGSYGRTAAQTSRTRLAPPPRRRRRPLGTRRRLPGDRSAPAPAPSSRPRPVGGGHCLSRGLSTAVTASPPAPPTSAARAGAHQPASASPRCRAECVLRSSRGATCGSRGAEGVAPL